MENTSKFSDDDVSTDEEEILQDFDLEAEKIINSETLPNKSSDRYLQVYEAYHKWSAENKNNLSKSDETNLIVYFKQLKEKLKPPTLWSIWSMLKKTLNARDQIDLNKFYNLKAILKNNSKGYKPKKSSIFTWCEIQKFLKDADDHVYLALKVILIFGISGALRCGEINNLKLQDVEDLNDKYLVTIQASKNDYNNGTISASRQLLIGPLFYNIIKQYILLRPADHFTDNFFIRYQQGKCVRQVIGINKIYEVPRTIATYLGLKDPQNYTGHCYRRTSATLLANSGADFSKVKQLGGWVSDKVCFGYVENSLHNREKIFNGVTHEARNQTQFQSRPSTSEDNSAQIAVENQVTDEELQWDDFSTNFTIDDLNSNKILQDNSKEQQIQEALVTTQNKLISSRNNLNTNKQQIQETLVTTQNQLISSRNNLNIDQLFSSKPPIRVQFNNASIEPRNKKIKMDSVCSSDLKNQVIENEENNNNFRNKYKDSCVKYENCTFHGNIINNFYCDDNRK